MTAVFSVDVFLTSAPLAQIKDYKVETDLDSTYTNADLKVKMDVSNLSSSNLENWSVDLAVYDEDGTNIQANATDDQPGCICKRRRGRHRSDYFPRSTIQNSGVPNIQTCMRSFCI